MISLKKHMEAGLEELADSTLDSYRAAMGAMGACGAQACPPAGQNFQQSLLALQQRLLSTVTAGLVAETEQMLEKRLLEYGAEASSHFKQKTEEVKEIVRLVARTAQALGERDQHYARQFTSLSARLQVIADLDDLTQMRVSLTESASELRCGVDQMTQDGRRSVTELEAELSAYQSRLEEAERLAGQDPLTGLDNRRKVELHLELLAHGKRVFSVMLFDLNGFKQINDTHGHAAGDQVLKQFARELRALFRATDAVGRWGGDEFITVLDCGLNEAHAQIERIHEWVFGEYKIDSVGGPGKVQVSAAIGLVAWESGDTLAGLLGRADAAMYEQKRHGLQRP